MNLKRLLYLLFLVPVIAFGQTGLPIAPNGPTVPLTATTAGNLPPPVQATSVATFTQQYIFLNNGSVTAFVAYGVSPVTALANCVIPTGPSNNVIPVFPLAAPIVTLTPNLYFCAITASSTAAVYIIPGVGQ